MAKRKTMKKPKPKTKMSKNTMMIVFVVLCIIALAGIILPFVRKAFLIAPLVSLGLILVILGIHLAKKWLSIVGSVLIGIQTLLYLALSVFAMAMFGIDAGAVNYKEVDFLLKIFIPWMVISIASFIYSIILIKKIKKQ